MTTEKRVDADGAKVFSDTIWSALSPDLGNVQQVFSWSDTSAFYFFHQASM